MADNKFLGKWKSDTLENFDDYMKALDVNFVLRKAGERSTTYIDITSDGTQWTWKYKIAFKSGELHFSMGEEFDEVTPDGRKVKSTFTMEDGALVQVQTGKPADTTISRTIEDGIMVEIATVTGNDVRCRRTYKPYE